MNEAVLRTTENRVLGPLTKVMFVIRMGFVRWGPEARHRWLLELRKACEETIRIVDSELR